jgi:hypothetical protein
MDAFDRLTKSVLDRITELLEARDGGSLQYGIYQFQPLHRDWTIAYLDYAEPRPEGVKQNGLAVLDKLRELKDKQNSLESAPAAGGRRYTRRYCKKTPCRRMGFTQKASCRPYKNCYKPTRS